MSAKNDDDDDEFAIGRRQLYEGMKQIKDWQKQLPPDDMSAMVELIKAYKIGKRTFFVMFWTSVFLGMAVIGLLGILGKLKFG